MHGTIPAMERVYSTPLLDKLGVRPGMRVALIDIDDDAIRSLLAERTSDITEGWPEPETDVVLLGADSREALAPLEALAARIRQNGAIWVVSRKGKAATLRDVEVIDAARAARLVDNKVASFSPTHTVLRLVIPVANRPR
jgi:5-enolpyruvylshikimate-3-phosphate synthase